MLHIRSGALYQLSCAGEQTKKRTICLSCICSSFDVLMPATPGPQPPPPLQKSKLQIGLLLSVLHQKSSQVKPSARVTPPSCGNFLPPSHDHIPCPITTNASTYTVSPQFPETPSNFGPRQQPAHTCCSSGVSPRFLLFQGSRRVPPTQPGAPNTTIQPCTRKQYCSCCVETPQETNAYTTCYYC